MNKPRDERETRDMGCLEAIDALYAWLDGELDEPSSIAEFEHHLGHCRSCFSRTEMERALSSRIRRSERNSAPEALQSRLRELIDKF
jgi:anti-sigma factor (TIGR02949 family)